MDNSRQDANTEREVDSSGKETETADVCRGNMFIWPKCNKVYLMMYPLGNYMEMCVFKTETSMLRKRVLIALQTVKDSEAET